MAKRLDRFPGGPTRDRYDWDQWFDGEPWLLKKGEDYEIATASMRAAVSRAAKDAGKKVRTRVGSDSAGTETLVIQAYE